MRDCGVAWPVGLCGPEPPAGTSEISPAGGGTLTQRGATDAHGGTGGGGGPGASCGTTYKGMTLDRQLFRFLAGASFTEQARASLPRKRRWPVWKELCAEVNDRLLNVRHSSLPGRCAGVLRPVLRLQHRRMPPLDAQRERLRPLLEPRPACAVRYTWSNLRSGVSHLCTVRGCRYRCLKPANGTTTGTLDPPPPGPPVCPVPHVSPGSHCDIKAIDECPSSCPCAPCPFSDPECGC